MRLWLTLLLSVCLLQFSESQTIKSFEFTVTIYEISVFIQRDCHYYLKDCKVIAEALCELSEVAMPSAMYTKQCTANTIRENAHNMTWNVQVMVKTIFPGGPEISLSCGTFGELFNRSCSDITMSATRPPFYIEVEGFRPIPEPYDPTMIKDAEYKVEATLCDSKYKPINASECKQINNTYLMNSLKNEMQFSRQMMTYLFTNEKITLSNITKSVQGDSCSTTFIVHLPKTYAMQLMINPSCDVAGIMQLGFNDTRKSTFTLCTAKVIDLALVTTTTTVTQETPTTIVTQETPTTTPSLASTVGSPFRTMVLSLAISYILA